MGMESRDAVWYPADADADGNCDGHLPPPMTRFASLLFAPLGWNRPARAGATARGAAAIADRRARMPAVRESMVAMPAVNAAIFYCCRNLSPKLSEIDASTRTAGDGQAGKTQGSKKLFVPCYFHHPISSKEGEDNNKKKDIKPHYANRF